MKNFLKYIYACVVAVMLVSCANDGDINEVTNGFTSEDEKGVLMLRVGTRNENDTNRDYILRIFKNEEGKSTLVRKYDSAKDTQPEYIWLLAGNYTATVESGKAVAATFNTEEQYFYGEESFDIVGGETTTVSLTAVIQNVPVEVVFDNSIVEGFNNGYYVDVVADETTKLQYTESKKGFFIMPEGVNKLTWHFVGTFDYGDGEVVNVDKSGELSDVVPQKGYKLTFRFSKETTGILGDFSITVDTSVEERDDHLSFSPDPELEGVGFDLKAPYNYAGGVRQYLAKSAASFCIARITVGSKVLDLVNGNLPGVELTGLNTTELYISLSDDFFNSLSGGSQNLNLYVEDTEKGSASEILPYNLQGASNSTSVDLWRGVATLNAIVFSGASNVQIACRQDDGEWQYYNASSAGNNSYKAEVSNIWAGRNYEYNLVINGKMVGTSATLKTEQGAQIPNGDLEDWCKDGDGVIIPYHTSSNPYWCTGNYGTAILSKNITQSSNDVRPGSKGTKSMYMDSEYIVVKFAAGNGYIGSWGGMDGTNAKVFFGQPFSYNAKPKAIRFWAKWNCGTIDKVSGKVGQKGDPDLCKIFCCMTTDVHMVDSSNGKGTTFSPSDADIKSGDPRYDKVLYSAYMESTESQTEWKEITIPFTFYGEDPNQVPTHLILTFTCSGYGDFFDGSTASWLYIDDIEFVY